MLTHDFLDFPMGPQGREGRRAYDEASTGRIDLEDAVEVNGGHVRIVHDSAAILVGAFRPEVGRFDACFQFACGLWHEQS
jgi:hypothetical protein